MEQNNVPQTKCTFQCKKKKDHKNSIYKTGCLEVKKNNNRVK